MALGLVPNLKFKPRKKQIRYTRERMNYYGPRQRIDGMWDYTVENDGVARPVGYCEGWVERNRSDFGYYVHTHVVEVVLHEQELRRAYVNNYHQSGHINAGEACLCYKTYLLDNELRLNVQMYETTKPCLVCKEPSNMCAEVDTHNFFILCTTHRTKDEVSKLYLRPGVLRIAKS